MTYVMAYVRVSSQDQNTARQLEAINNSPYSPNVIYTEKVSGATRQRPELQKMLDAIPQGLTEDVLVLVKSPDRLARSARDLLNIINEINAKGANVRFIDRPEMSTDDKTGKLMLTVLAAVAEFERDTIKERQREGIDLALKQGKFQRKPKLSPAKCQEIRQLHANGVPVAKLARSFSVSRPTISHVINKTGSYSQR